MSTIRWNRVLFFIVLVIILSMAAGVDGDTGYITYLPQLHTDATNIVRQDGRIIWVKSDELWITAEHESGHIIKRPSYETENGREVIMFLDRPGNWVIDGFDTVHISAGNEAGLLNCERLSTQEKDFYLGDECGVHLAFGAGSPENMFACADVPNTPYPEYVNCYQRIDVLADKGFNEAYVILMNIGGDGKDVWPFCSPINRYGSPDNDVGCYDEAKLRYLQDLVIYAHRRGIVMQFFLGEQEEANVLQIGNWGPDRQKYIWNMIAWLGFGQSYFIIYEEFDSTGLSFNTLGNSLCMVGHSDPLAIAGLHQFSQNFLSIYEPYYNGAASHCFDVYSLQTYSVHNPDALVAVCDSLSGAGGQMRPCLVSEPEAINIHGVRNFCNQAVALRDAGYGIHFFHSLKDQSLEPDEIPVSWGDCFD